MMNFDNSKDISEEIDMLKWIDDNISLTDFVDYQDAADRWVMVKTLHQENLLDNYSIYEELASVSPTDLFEVMPTPQPPAETQTEGCPGCIATFNTCQTTAGNKYVTDVVAISDHLVKNPSSVQTTVTLFVGNLNNYLIEIRKCAIDLIGCCPN